jgi:hypothetical protein
MSTRKLYTERTNLVIKDLKDQPEEEYIAIIETLGEKSAVAFTKVVFNGPTVLLLNAPSKLAEAQGKMVAAFGVESNWVIVRRDVFLEMNGGEWDQHKIEDAKNRTEMNKKLFGDGRVIQVATFPDGKQAVLPATDEQTAAFEKAKSEQGGELKKGVSETHFGQYV